METGSLSRKELYDLVWSNSMVALSKKYAISDNGLRKICKRMNIPLPGNGHWMKLQFGKRVKIKPLTVDNIEKNKEPGILEKYLWMKKKYNDVVADILKKSESTTKSVFTSYLQQLSVIE